jgi:hypothetical protein
LLLAHLFRMFTLLKHLSMSRYTSTKRQLIPFDFDIMVTVRESDTAAKKEEISSALRSAISSEYRKYLKAQKLKSADPSFVHQRNISFQLDQPNPRYGIVITYALRFGPDGVTVELVSLRPDPEIAPILGPVNLSKVATEFFNPADFGPRKGKLTAVPAESPGDRRRPAA